MSSTTNVLITGVNRGKPKSTRFPSRLLITDTIAGLGKALLETYLARPNHVVIGSVRDTSTTGAKALRTLAVGRGSKLVLVKIDSQSTTDAVSAIKELEASGVKHLDVVIANAGGSVGGVQPLAIVQAQNMIENFVINTVGPLLLFQATRPLLEQTFKESRTPKWMTMSSAAGSISNMEKWKSHIVPAYGAAKAGVNWLTVSAHCGNPWLVAFAVHPGFVQTESGNRSARGIGMEKAPDTLDSSVSAITKLIDGSSRETTSGRFWSVIEGAEIAW